MPIGTGISPSELGVLLLQNCRNELLSLFPRLDTAFAALPCRPEEEVPGGVAADAAALYFAPAHLIRLYRDCPAAVRRGCLHILLHMLYLHPFPVQPPSLWDLACDMAVEQIIQRQGIPRLNLPPHPVRADCFRRMGEGPLSAEGIRIMLAEGRFPHPVEEMAAAFAFDSHALWRAPEVREREEFWRGTAGGLGRNGGGAGSSAGSGGEVLSAFGRSTCDYRTFLRRFTVLREEMALDPEQFDQLFYCYGLEQYGDLPLIEPLEYQEANRLSELVIAIDTSGSCSTETVRRFLTETYAILSNQENFFREMTVYLLQCDCCVQSVRVLRSPEDWLSCCGHMTVEGRGGTDFTPVFRYVERLRREGKLKNLKALLYFTDGDGVYPGTPTDYETAFVFLRRTPFMARIPPWAILLTVEP